MKDPWLGRLRGDVSFRVRYTDGSTRMFSLQKGDVVIVIKEHSDLPVVVALTSKGLAHVAWVNIERITW